MAAERRERPPPKAQGRWSGGEAAGTDTGGWQERVEARPPSSGGRIAALTCGERGRDRDMDERQRRWRHSDGEAQQEDAARRPEIGTNEPTDWKGQWLGETEAARGELLHAARSRGSRLVSLNHVGNPVGLRGSRGRRGASMRARREMKAAIAAEHGTRG